MISARRICSSLCSQPKQDPGRLRMLTVVGRGMVDLQYYSFLPRKATFRENTLSRFDAKVGTALPEYFFLLIPPGAGIGKDVLISLNVSRDPCETMSVLQGAEGSCHDQPSINLGSTRCE